MTAKLSLSRFSAHGLKKEVAVTIKYYRIKHIIAGCRHVACRLTHALGVRLLRQQEAGQHLLACLIIDVLLELEQRLGLVLRKPQRFEVARTKAEWQVL